MWGWEGGADSSETQRGEQAAVTEPFKRASFFLLDPELKDWTIMNWRGTMIRLMVSNCLRTRCYPVIS